MELSLTLELRAGPVEARVNVYPPFATEQYIDAKAENAALTFSANGHCVQLWFSNRKDIRILVDALDKLDSTWIDAEPIELSPEPVDETPTDEIPLPVPSKTGECLVCHGAGEKNGELCAACGGTGVEILF